MNSFVYNLASWVSKYILLPLYARLEVTGAENIPMEGPLIIASNHLNDADPGILCTRVRRPIAFMAKVELFKVPGLAQFLRAFGAFPVRRGEADLSALRQANAALAKGLAVCIFPEGTREGSPERLAEGLPGAAILALRGEIPILPVAISGSGRMALPKMFLSPHRPSHVTMRIGKPFTLPKPERINDGSTREGTRRIMESIAALLPEGHRGYYEYISQKDGVPPSSSPSGSSGPGRSKTEV
jgi:1-acyl-sn-glycerol-3-phosphate acyltransferase